MPNPINLSTDAISNLLASTDDIEIDSPSNGFQEITGISPQRLYQSAVLMPLLIHESSWHLLFTRRNVALPEHSGQVAFPGGRCDPDDETIEFTALREAEEEIGLIKKDVRVIGRLNRFLTVTRYLVTPIVGVIPWPYQLRLANEEVSRVFTIPLEWLAAPANHEIRKRVLPDPFGKVPVVYFREYDGEVLWGASARFTLRLIKILDL